MGTNVRGIQLGPNHKNYGQVLETLAAAKPRGQHAPRRGRPPKARPGIDMPPEFAPPQTVAQLLLAYRAEHEHRIARPCDCPLCAYLGTLIAQKRDEQRTARDGR